MKTGKTARGHGNDRMQGGWFWRDIRGRIKFMNGGVLARPFQLSGQKRDVILYSDSQGILNCLATKQEGRIIFMIAIAGLLLSSAMVFALTSDDRLTIQKRADVYLSGLLAGEYHILAEMLRERVNL